MVDGPTTSAYDAAPARYADEWEHQPAPEDLYGLLARFFAPGPTLDVGCGSGRDTAWLAASGYDASGCDASPGLLAEARTRHRGLLFVEAALPELEGITSAAYTNVLCETVLMHLDPSEVPPAVARLVELLVPGGHLYVSWRVTDGSSRRDGSGRLYSAFDPRLVTDALTGASVRHEEEAVSRSSGRTVHRVVARRVAAG